MDADKLYRALRAISDNVGPLAAGRDPAISGHAADALNGGK